MSGRRRARPGYRWTAGVGVLAVVVAAVLVETSGDRAPEPPRTAVPTPSVPPPVATVEEFCAAFSSFAASHSGQLANPDRDTAAPLEAAGEQLLEVGRPPGMSDLEAAGLRVLVEDTLEPFRDPGSGEAPAVPPSRASDDLLALDAFNGFLSATCSPR